MCVYVCVRGNVCVCVCERECVCMCEKKSVWERVCVSVCM